jgi:hypothetical protein
MGRGRARRKTQRWGEKVLLALGGRYGPARGAGGRVTLLGALAQDQMAGYADRRDRMSQDCVRMSRGEERHVVAQRRKAEESSGVWPYSDEFFLICVS